MAQHRSAMKRIRQSEKRRTRNRASRSEVKTQVKRLRAAIGEGSAESASKLLPETVAQIDKAAKKGVIHHNTAARSKSRLTRQVNALEGAAEA